MTLEDMKITLSELGIETIDTRGDEIQGACPAHEERTGHVDRNPSWYINATSGAHICFSCGFKGSLYYLVGYVRGFSFDEGEDWDDSTKKLIERMSRLSHPAVKEEEERSVVTESMLSAFIEPHEPALSSRGLSLRAVRAHQILWDRHNESWIIPVRDPVGVLLGWQEKGYTGRFFKNQPKGMKKGKSLFGYDEYTGGRMIVVESPLDVVRLTSLGITGGASTYGCVITPEQLNVIRGADEVVFALDNDTAGQAASRDMLQRCKELKIDAWFFDYSGTDCKDVGGMSKEEILKGLANAKHMLRGERATR